MQFNSNKKRQKSLFRDWRSFCCNSKKNKMIPWLPIKSNWLPIPNVLLQVKSSSNPDQYFVFGQEKTFV